MEVVFGGLRVEVVVGGGDVSSSWGGDVSSTTPPFPLPTQQPHPTP